MMFRAEIRLDNAALEEPGELSRILHGLAGDVDRFVDSMERGSKLILWDANGNRVGTAWVEAG
jgi:hypothetical protein